MFHNALLNEDLQDKCFDVLAVGFCAGGIACCVTHFSVWNNDEPNA